MERFVVRRALREKLRDSMLKCFPLAYTTNSPTDLSTLIHMSGPAPMYGEKTKLSSADFFSVTPQLLWDRFVTE